MQYRTPCHLCPLNRALSHVEGLRASVSPVSPPVTSHAAQDPGSVMDRTLGTLGTLWTVARDTVSGKVTNHEPRLKFAAVSR